MFVEDRMRQERSRAIEPLVVTGVRVEREVFDAEIGNLSAIERSEQVRNVIAGNRLIECDANASIVHESQVDAATLRLVNDRLGIALPDRDTNGVEVIVVNDGEAESTQPLGEGSGVAVDATCDPRQTLRPV